VDSDSDIDLSEYSARPSDNIASSSESNSTPHSKITQRTLLRPRHAKTPRRTEDRRLKGRKAGTIASSDARVENAPISGRRRARHSTKDMQGIHAARLRVAARRREDAKKIRLEQIKKQILTEARALRQRAADLEREAEDAARIALEMDEDEEEEEKGRESEPGPLTAMEEDRDDVLSNYSHAPTEVYSDSEQEHWLRPRPSPQQQRQGGLSSHRRHAVPMVHCPSQPQEQANPVPQPFVVVTREVESFNNATGSLVRQMKRYRVRVEDLESLDGDTDREEL
jgi:hypothetical protein